MKRFIEKYYLSRCQINLRILILIFSISMSIILVISFFILGEFVLRFGTDFIAYWSAGKIADELGYSEIYDLDNLREIQTNELESLGILFSSEISSFRILPANYFSFFILPFQFLSRMDLMDGYWLWTVFNLAILIVYLIFFMKNTMIENGNTARGFKLLLLIIFSYTVLSNFILGQVSVFMLVCSGEFIRNAINKKFIVSGIWLGGLIIKPQSLVLILPVLFIKHYWKILRGFLYSAGIVIFISLILSGFSGNAKLINLWGSSSLGDYTTNAEAFINWRMIGLNFNLLFDTTYGWVITGLGMPLTLIALYYLIRKDYPHGSPSWVIMQLGVFSANLSFTWHSHQHMAMVLIPFLIYALINNLINWNVLFLWSTISQVVWFGMIMSGATVNNYVMAVAISGFALNLFVFVSTVKILNTRTRQYFHGSKKKI